MKKRLALSVVLVMCLTATLALAYTAEQADRGQKVFAQHCAVCHGGNGQGGEVPQTFKGYAGMKAPPVAGPGALPNMQTAENVYSFIKQHMPLQKPGSLSDQEYLDIVAFDLKANNIGKPGTEPLTPQALPTIKLNGKGK